MKTLTLNIPDNVDLDNSQVAMPVASVLYENGKLSLGQAAELAGLTKDFYRITRFLQCLVFNFPTSEISSDVANA